MSPVLTVIVSIVGVLALLALFTVWFCVHCAKKVLHPTSKRKPLDAWPDQFGLPYENVYFKTEYPEHNLVRAKNQLALVADMEKHLPEMEEIINNL